MCLLLLTLLFPLSGRERERERAYGGKEEEEKTSTTRRAMDERRVPPREKEKNK